MCHEHSSPLHGCGPFARHSPAELDQLRLETEVVDFPADRTLVHQGRLIQAVFVIVSGTLAVVEDGCRIRGLGVGACVGGAELARDVLVWPASVASITDVVAVRVTPHGFRDAVRTLPGLAADLDLLLGPGAPAATPEKFIVTSP